MILLAGSVLAFASLTHQTVPISTMQTVTREFTETLTSYTGYTATDTILSSYLFTVNLSSTITELAQSSYLVNRVSTTLYSETFAFTMTEASTSIVPTFTVLGLVSGFLILSTVWITLKLAKKPRKRARRTKRFVTASRNYPHQTRR